MDVKRHLKDEDRLNQALNGKLPELVEEFQELLKKYNLDLMPETAFDCCKYALEEIQLAKINLPECRQEYDDFYKKSMKRKKLGGEKKWIVQNANRR